MRYRLRTLLIVLAVGPLVLAGAWWLLHSKFRFDDGLGSLVLAVSAVLLVFLAIAAER